MTQGVLAWHIDFCTPAHISVVIPRRLNPSRGLNSFFIIIIIIIIILNLALPGLSWSMGDLVPQPGIEPGPFALGAHSLSHCTTREVPEFILHQVRSYSFFSNSSTQQIMKFKVNEAKSRKMARLTIEMGFPSSLS